ncbi:MAG: acetyl-CoA carboxylase biotin carboxylase subunit, partial [Planctomycetes bacterium]|nr:acetyl-CoA carboxylase biotin carboxylase subunit [Planctomycetota bacterium]
MPFFRRLLIANRGEIALRVIRTAQELGIETVAIYSDPDRDALHVRRADHAVALGGESAKDSYLRADKVLEAAARLGCDALHPGYGFLSENAGFAAKCEAAGIAFVGPPTAAITAMGDKVEARKIAAAAGVPLVPGLQENVDASTLARRAAEIGYPVMLKAAAGGGGKGIRIVENEKGLTSAFELARAEAASAFGDDRVYLEKFVTRPRHVEIQIMADRHGGVVAYGERECSVQRRHQKLVEESPSPAVTPELRERMCRAAIDLAKAVDYVGAGTVEFLCSEGEFYFLEMNTRLQVEHPVTEMRFGVDLVEEQLRVAAGEHVRAVPEPQGHAIEVRVNAEDPATFFPSLGRIARIGLPGGPGVRLDSAIYNGLTVTPHYDSMLAKLVVHGANRAQAIARCERALREFRLVGVSTSMPVALRVMQNAEFRGGDYDTGILERIDRGTAPQRRELAMLAAAAARFLAAERSAASAA